MNSDTTKQDRQNRLLSYLLMSDEQNAFSVADLFQRLKSDGFEINRKTVDRDIAQLSLEHPGLCEIEGRPARYYFEPGYQVHYSINFKEDHLQTIIIALQNLQTMGCPTVADLCRETEDVLLSKLSAYDRKDFAQLKSKSTIAKTVLGKSQGTQKDTYKQVFDCLRRERAFLCHYQSPYDQLVEKRLFHPLMLHFVGGAPYLFVYDSLDKNKIKILRLSRIRDVEVTIERVDLSYKDKINLEHAFGAYGTGSEKIIAYTIYCTTPMANKFKEQQIHPSQVVEKIEEDLYRIEFNLNDSHEIIKYLSQFAESIKKIEPEDIYKKVQAIWEAGLKKTA
jgi:predicted DNA-binding transcriptional regulator YafY